MAGEDYWAIRQSNREQQAYWNVQPPRSCPNDGTLLITGPPSNPGILFCPFDGWQYPRDWAPPFSMP